MQTIRIGIRIGIKDWRKCSKKYVKAFIVDEVYLWFYRKHVLFILIFDLFDSINSSNIISQNKLFDNLIIWNVDQQTLKRINLI